jgi:two-component system nitrogen regulation response regulator NtrX
VTPRRIAVVDDEAPVLESLAGLLASFGYAVVAHLSGEAFLGSADWQNVDCLISDIAMPGMNGIELFFSVRRLRPTLPVIIISGCPEKYWSVLALKAGARYFFEKPLNIPEFIAAIRGVLDQPP